MIRELRGEGPPKDRRRPGLVGGVSRAGSGVLTLPSCPARRLGSTRRWDPRSVGTALRRCLKS
eukprot:8639364-Alexandrium_andersonii.AAC.1